MAALSLDYAFRPNPVRTSQVGLDSRVDLDILVSAPLWLMKPLTRIDIAIPTGGDEPGLLQVAPQFTTPEQPADPNWRVAAVGSTIRLMTASGRPKTVTSLEVTVPGILVNRSQGTVDIDVTETAGDGTEAGQGTAAITKWDETVLVENFRCDPPRVTGPYEPGTLRWGATSAGKGHPFKVCTEDGETLQTGVLDPTWKGGVAIAPADTTTYVLQITGPGTSAFPPLKLRVPVLRPLMRTAQMSRNLGGWIVELHWQAENASHCSVLVDDVEVDSAAPLDTWQDGYALVSSPGSHRYKVVAHAPDGKGEQDGDEQIAPSPRSPLLLEWLGEWKGASGISAFDATSDASLALGATPKPPMLQLIRPIGGALEEPVALAGGTVTDVALIRGTMKALVALSEVQGGARCLMTFDLAGGGAGHSLQVADDAGTISGMALVDPDGSRALIATGSGLALVDVGAGEIVQTFAGGGGGPDLRSRVAVTPDGTLALSLGPAGLLVQPLNGGGATTLPLDVDKCTPAISGDGKLALIAARPSGGTDTTAALLDVAGRKFVGDPLTVGTARGDAYIAATFLSGDRLAIVADDGGLHVIDVPRWKVVGTVALDTVNCCGVMASPTTALVAGNSGLLVYGAP